MKVKLLTTAVCASLALTAWADGARAADALNLSLPATAAGTAALAQSQDAQSQDASQATDEQKKAKELNKIVVTGSLIPRAQIETATPSVQITAEDIKAQGFKSVYEALKSTPFATGGVQGNQDSASFTQGAQTLSLFGLDPGFTLILVDGHPLADYPLLYNGESNFVDLSSIPTAMVDHIDIVPGNQSAIYGSSAIAGVVNIVLKQKVDGIDLGVRVGGYSQGGGASQRISLVGGHSFGKLDAIFGLQYDNSDPIWAYQRNWTDSYLDNPSGNGVASRDRLHLAYSLPDFSYLGYIDPGEHACDGITNLFNGTEKYQYRPGSGYYCGSTETAGYTTLKNKYQDTAGYLSLKMPLGDNAQAYANFIFDHSKVFYNVGSGYTWWGANDGGYFVDANAGQLALAQWAFAPEEVGGYENIGSNQVKDAYNSTIGVRGNFGDSDWAYDAYYDRSQVWVTSHERERMSAKIDAYFENLFLGPQLGEWYGYPVYAPDWDKFYTNAITPEVYRSFTDMLTSKSQSWMQHVNAVFTNTNLFDLPGGSAGIAALVQAGNQHWSLRPDQRFVDGEVWGSVRRTGHGKRNNYAAAVEMNLPLFSMLTVDASARYDNFKYAGRSDGKATYKLGLEFRPIDTLLFRANYSTAFRAPDMGRIFTTPSGFYSSTTDYYWCDINEPGVDYSECSQGASVQFKGTQEGNRNLKDINAESWGAGVVWSPTSNFNLRLDYLNIKIKDEVANLSVGKIMRDEADCREGKLDINSPTCVDALQRVHRDTRGLVDAVIVSPINVSKERVNAITAGADYRWDIGSAGQLTFGLSYNNMLKHEKQQYAGDPFDDLLQPGFTTDFKSILSGTIGWRVGNWNSTLYGVRYGKRANYQANYVSGDYSSPGAGRTPAWALFNASVGYDLPHNANISLIVNNLANKMPPRDKTFTAWPYYETQAYTVYGRSIFAEFTMHFGN